MLIDLDKKVETEPQDESKVKKDCFAYDDSKAGNYQCRALTELCCKYKECRFYKPKDNRR